MRDHGTFKIGRLEEFRALESSQLQDGGEGLNAVRGASEVNYHDLPARNVARTVIHCDPSVANLTIKLEEGGEIAEPFDFPTFCFSYSSDEKTRRSLCDSSNGYDAVVAITDIFAMADLMAANLSLSTSRDVKYVCAPVIYRANERKLTDPSPENLAAAFEKPARFSDNCEGRIVFFFAEQRNFCRIWTDAISSIAFNGIVALPDARHLLR